VQRVTTLQPSDIETKDDQLSLAGKKIDLEYFGKAGQALIEKLKNKTELSDDDMVILALTVAQAMMNRNIDPESHCSDEETLNAMMTVLDDTRVVEAALNKIRQIVSHHFETLTHDKKPQDQDMEGSGLKFEPLEHDEMTMPHVIKVTDTKGRWALYEISSDGGVPVLSHGYDYGVLREEAEEIEREKANAIGKQD
jgi:hypothetical protein